MTAGIVTASTGNHGQSIAFASQRAGVSCTVAVPLGNNPEKNAAIRAFGATVIEHGRDFDEAREWGFGAEDYTWLDADEASGRVNVAGALGAVFTSVCVAVVFRAGGLWGSMVGGGVCIVFYVTAVAVRNRRLRMLH